MCLVFLALTSFALGIDVRILNGLLTGAVPGTTSNLRGARSDIRPEEHRNTHKVATQMTSPFQ
jgi:hypothetical protein